MYNYNFTTSSNNKIVNINLQTDKHPSKPCFIIMQYPDCHFQGQFVAYEIAHVADSACPMELLKIPVPDDDPDFRTNDSTVNYIPFVRSGYNLKTGQSPNNPRRPVSWY